MEDMTETRITLRLPAKLRDRLQNASEMNSRSMNGEIVERLDWSFDRAAAEMTDLLEKAVAAEERASEASRQSAETNFRLRTEQSEKTALIEQITALQQENKALLERLAKAPSGAGFKMAMFFDKMLMDAANGDDALLQRTLEIYRQAPSIAEVEERLRNAEE